MILLHSFNDKYEAELALSKIKGSKRLASERDSTETVYNLFGDCTWGNFYRLGLFNLVEFESILKARENHEFFDELRYNEIVNSLRRVASIYRLEFPKHWL